MITDKEGNIISPVFPEGILEKLYKVRSYKAYRIVLTIFTHGIISSDNLVKLSGQSNRYVEELLSKLSDQFIIQRYLDQSNNTFYAVHKSVLNSSYKCNGCKYAKVHKKPLSPSKTIKVTDCKLKSITCAHNYFRCVKTLKECAVALGLKETTFIEKIRNKQASDDIDKEIEDWDKSDVVHYFYKEFKNKFRKRLTNEVSKLHIRRCINVIYTIFEEDYEEEANFYLIRYIKYSFAKAEAEGFMPSSKRMSETKAIKDFQNNDNSSTYKKCRTYGIYCPYWKHKKCNVGVECNKKLRSKIKKHYNS